MKLSLEVSSALYKIINVGEINSLITGKIFIGDVPDTSQDENISIKVLTNTIDYLQNGIVNLNLYVPQVQSGRANNQRFKKIINVLSFLVDGSRMDDVHFQLDDDKGIFKDNDIDGMYFYNLRLEFQTFKNI